MWQSPDPILNQYMDGEPNRGVFSPKNLNLYTYTHNNPINLVDPTGMFSETYQKAKKQYNRLNTKERHVFWNVLPATKLSKLSDNVHKANATTTKIFGRNNKGDRSDAFRHAYWQALNTQDIGENATRELSSAHEYSTPPSDVDTDLFMDMHNNDVGIEIGKNNPTASPKQLQKIILSKMKQGELMIIKNDKLHTSDGLGLKNIFQIRQYGESNKISNELKNNTTNKFKGKQY